LEVFHKTSPRKRKTQNDKKMSKEQKAPQKTKKAKNIF